VYAVDDVVAVNNATYVCLEAHTANAQFSVDLDVDRWELFAEGQVTTSRVFEPTSLTAIENCIDLIKTFVSGAAGASAYATAADLLDSNRQYIEAEVIAYINTENEDFDYNQVLCARDVGFIVDALVYDLTAGGNYNSVIAGRSYYAEAGTHHIVQLEENVTDPALFPDNAIVTFYQRSYISAAGYLFEYVGSGANYGALPQRGVVDPVQSKEVVQLNNGKVFFTSTDQNGDFRIGTGLVISQATGVLSGRTFTKSLFANLTPFILAIEG
jgi:hypothetical protein